MSLTDHFRTQPAAACARRLLGFLSRHRHSISPLLILTHDYPDPDALAAAYALHFLVQQRYKIESRIAYGGVIGRSENKAMVKILNIPAHKLRPSDLKRYRHIALVDTQPNFTNNSFRGNRKAALIIDQHASTSKPLARLSLVDTGCGATCVIVAVALLLLRMEIPSRVATALAYGILSDTLDLYRARREDVIQTYLRVLPHCDMKALARIQNPLHSRPFFIALRKSIRNAVAVRRLLVSHLGPIANPDLVSQMAEVLLTYVGASWSLCTGRYKDKLHVSLRARQTDAQAGEVLRDVFAKRQEAGGHAAIAGGSFRVGANASEEAWAEAEQSLQARLAKRLRLPARTEVRRPFAGRGSAQPPTP